MRCNHVIRYTKTRRQLAIAPQGSRAVLCQEQYRLIPWHWVTLFFFFFTDSSAIWKQLVVPIQGRCHKLIRCAAPKVAPLAVLVTFSQRPCTVIGVFWQESDYTKDGSEENCFRRVILRRGTESAATARTAGRNRYLAQRSSCASNNWSDPIIRDEKEKKIFRALLHTEKTINNPTHLQKRSIRLLKCLPVLSISPS